jgi:hypothetical protein
MKTGRALIILTALGAAIWGFISEACDDKTVSTGSSACDDTKTTCESTSPSGGQCANEYFVAMFPTDCNTPSTGTFCHQPSRDCSIPCKCKPDPSNLTGPCIYDSYSGAQGGQKKKNEPDNCPKS